MDLDTLPGLHTASAPPTTSTRVDESADTRAVVLAPRDPRSFRARAQMMPAPGPATEDTSGSQIMAHVTPGTPDPRASWETGGGKTIAADPGAAWRPESVSNTREVETINTQAVIDRPRAGSIGTDPTRPASMPRWLFAAPVDQWAQYGVPAHPKVELPSPVASLPISYTADLADALPTAAGSGATVNAGWDLGANTYRVLPSASDAQLVTRNVDPGVAYETVMRSRGWRR